MRQALVVRRQKARQRFVERRVDAGGRYDARHQRRGAEPTMLPMTFSLSGAAP
jgi:hypothetical protein